MIGNMGDQLAKAVEKVMGPYQDQNEELLKVLTELNFNVIRLTLTIENQGDYLTGDRK